LLAVGTKNWHRIVALGLVVLIKTTMPGSCKKKKMDTTSKSMTPGRGRNLVTIFGKKNCRTGGDVNPRMSKGKFRRSLRQRRALEKRRRDSWGKRKESE